MSASKSQVSPLSLPTKMAVRGGNRSICHSVGPEKFPITLEDYASLGSPIIPVILGCSGLPEEACPEASSAWGPAPAHQAQRMPLPKAAPQLQLEHPCEPPWNSLLSKFTDATTSLRQLAENWEAKKTGLYGVNQRAQLDARILRLGPDFAPNIRLI